jgi:outer membrane biosynthesis protein TonB
MNSKLTIVLLTILSTGQQLRAANINQQSQSIVGGNSNSFNRNVGKSVVQNINNFGSLLFPDEPQPQPQEQQQQQPVPNSEPLKPSQQQPVPDSQPQPQPNDPQQQPNSKQQQVSNSPQLEPLPDRQQTTNSPQSQRISVNSQPIQISLIPSLRQIPI